MGLSVAVPEAILRGKSRPLCELHTSPLWALSKYKSKQKGRPRINPELAPLPEGVLPTGDPRTQLLRLSTACGLDMQAVTSLT